MCLDWVVIIMGKSDTDPALRYNVHTKPSTISTNMVNTMQDQDQPGHI